MKKLVLSLVVLTASFSVWDAIARNRAITLTSETKLPTSVYVVLDPTQCDLSKALRGPSSEAIVSLGRKCDVQVLNTLASKGDQITIPLTIDGKIIDKIIVANDHGNAICDVSNGNLAVYTGGKSKVLKAVTGYSAGHTIQCMGYTDYKQMQRQANAE